MAYANMVRGQMNEKDRTWPIAYLAYELVSDEGCSKVTDYLNRIEATPAERAVSAERAADARIEKLSAIEKVTRDDIDSLRAWVATVAPDSIESVTGKALARSTEINLRLSFGEAGQLALEYHAASGNDDVLVGFLDSAAGYFHMAEARVIAGSIIDPKRRNEMLHHF